MTYLIYYQLTSKEIICIYNDLYADISSATVFSFSLPDNEALYWDNVHYNKNDYRLALAYTNKNAPVVGLIARTPGYHYVTAFEIDTNLKSATLKMIVSE